MKRIRPGCIHKLLDRFLFLREITNETCLSSSTRNQQLGIRLVVIMKLHCDKTQLNLNLNQFTGIKRSVYRLSCLPAVCFKVSRVWSEQKL